MGRYEKIHELESELNGAELNIGIVMSRYNIDVSKGLLDSCTAELEKNGVLNIVMITVPGALEIPLALQKMALTDQFDALVALGAVVRGDTYHFEVVSTESAGGITAVQLDTGIPVANGILTTNTNDQALERMSQKGAEAARVAIEMVHILRKLDEEIQ
jgi:6,7-dimethyl-8-ribityllumazine synthase|tara:strand:- start:2 stop:478 length:477 start_codon:yes stop_codon:yes gene_type:complete